MKRPLISLRLVALFGSAFAIIALSACAGGGTGPIEYTCPGPIEVGETATVSVWFDLDGQLTDSAQDGQLRHPNGQIFNGNGWEWATISSGGTVGIEPVAMPGVNSGENNFSTQVTGVSPGSVLVTVKQPLDQPAILFFTESENENETDSENGPCNVVVTSGSDSNQPGATATSTASQSSTPVATTSATQGTTPTATPVPIATAADTGSDPASAIDPSESLADGLVGLWHFDGNASDSSGSGNNGIASPGVTYGSGVFGQALQFDPIQMTFVRVPDAPNLNPTDAISVQAWYNGPAFQGAGNNALIDKGASEHKLPFYQYHLGITGSDYVFAYTGNRPGFNFTLDSASKSMTNTPQIQHGAWYHLMFTYDGETAVFYINGATVHSAKLSGSMPGFGDPGFSTDLFIGTYANLQRYPTHFIPGAVDEVAIWERGLSPDEVTELFERGLSN